MTNFFKSKIKLMIHLLQDGKFVLGFHRYGNSKAGLEEVDALRKELVDGSFSVAAEGDLKWLREGGKDHLYFNHGTLIHGTKYDIIKNGKRLAQKEKDDSIVMLEQVVDEYPDLNHMIHIKNGIGPIESALETMTDVFERAGAYYRYFLFAHSLDTIRKAKKVANVPVGSIHRFATGDRLVHLPDYDITEALTNNGLFIRPEDLPSDFVITKKSVKDKKPYMAHLVKDRASLDKAIANKSLGGFMYMTPADFNAMLGS